jgi:nitrate/TMAO reductase-like tetraheme cytochrome c subunit
MPPVKARRFAVPLRILVQLGVLAIIFVSVSSVAFIEYSAQPVFCTNCHIMEPYYESWAGSSHNDVPCIKCHYAPGIKAEAMGKLQAANQVVKYVTGTYGLKPWAEIEDAACLRSGCHEQRRLEGVVSFNGVLFDHAHHLGELRRGKQLRCTSCHSQIVQGDHLTVTPTTCFLCHFKGQPAGEAVGGCIACHVSPQRVVTQAGVIVDHPQYVKDLVSCVSCHNTVTDGSGDAEEARCFNCHNEPERIAEFENTTVMHRIHIAERNVECNQCHVPMEHRVVSLTAEFDLDCASCHRSVHEAQQRLYAGIGGHETESMPSAMFLARVSCSACHELQTEIRGHEQVNLAGEASCLSCHGIRYANVLPSWQESMETKLTSVRRVVNRARQALGSGPASRRGAADSLLSLAAENVELVEVGRGTHNVGFADQLLRAALGLTEEAVTAGRLTYTVPNVDLGPPVSENTCLQCHAGIERQDVPFTNTAFDHERHIVRGDVACTSCHTPFDDHGRTTVTASSCASCHHSETEPLSCVRCHAGADGAPADTFALATGDFPHPVHRDANLACSQCHTAPTMTAADLQCANCHDSHHQPEVTCLSCHRGGAQDRHPGAMVHMTCSACHGAKAEGIDRWTRQVCTACHADRVDHNAPADCVLCHDISPLGGNDAVAPPTALHDVESEPLLGTMQAWLEQKRMPLPTGGLR